MTSVFQTNIGRQATAPTTSYQQSYQQSQAYAAQHRPTITDDYERWYTENVPSNRMLLSLRSGIDSEISWALDRLCRLCNNEQFVLAAIPGLTDALFVWPDWFVGTGAEECAKKASLFALPKTLEKHRRHALEAMFILKNSAVNDANAVELATHPRTRSLILLALHRMKPDSDANTEFLTYIVELLQQISGTLVLPPPDSPLLANPVPPLQTLAATASDRSLIISSLRTLMLQMANPANIAHLTPDTPALSAAIRYLPLLSDKLLVETCLNYLYTHLSHPPMTKAFLLHPELASTLKLLVIIMLSEQVEETISINIAGPVHTAPAVAETSKDYELSQEELERLLPIPEPQRCYEWMKIMFDARPDGELTQVEVWNAYREAFYFHKERYPVLAASDVIKNVNAVFDQAHAMVLPGPPQRFIVRGVERRKVRSDADKFKCRWDRSECTTETFASAGELYEHVLAAHIDAHPDPELPCTWSSCTHPPLPKSHLRGHVLTHLPSSQPAPLQPGQQDRITLPSEGFPNPISNPTSRPVPPVRDATITYKQPSVDPPSNALTALLCIRVLFRVAFASAEAAPRADDDHFGFPGIIEDTGEDEELTNGASDSEKRGERRGRKAFTGVRHLLEGVRIRDETLMEWITEMVDAGLDGTT
ncbi:unnamed protein product [Somion occarium]